MDGKAGKVRDRGQMTERRAGTLSADGASARGAHKLRPLPQIIIGLNGATICPLFADAHLWPALRWGAEPTNETRDRVCR